MTKPMTQEKLQFIVLRDAIANSEGLEKAALEGAILDAKKLVAYHGESAVVAMSYTACEYLDARGEL